MLSYRHRMIPEMPAATLYDGTKIKRRKPERIAVPRFVDEDDAPPPLLRRGGWHELFLCLLLLPVFLGLAGFANEQGPQSTLLNLPFVDLTNPAYNIAGNGTTDDYTNLQAVFTNNGAATYYGGYSKRYLSSKPILYVPGTWVRGAGVNRRQTISGTTFLVASGASAADWAGQGYFTSAGFANNTKLTGLGEICGFVDFLIDMNAQTYGNGILTAGIAQPFFINLRFENYKGTQGMPTRGAGVAKNFGQGFSICLTIYTIGIGGASAGDASTANNPNDPTFLNVRNTAHSLGSNGCPMIWTDDGARNDAGNSTITDGILYIVQPEGAGVASSISNQAAVAQGVVDIQHAGGWHLDFLHLNGSGGQGLVMRNCMATHVTNGWLDGWGTAATNGSTYDCIQATSTTGGGASNTSLTIWGNTVRFRDEQTNGGGTVTYNWLNYNASGANSSLVVTGNNGFVQSNLATGTLFLFKFALGGGVINALIDSNQFLSEVAGTVLEDARIFDTSIPNASITVKGNNNSWNFSATPTPTAGNWPAGYRRFNSAPAVGSTDYSVCTAGGAPGTWASQILGASTGKQTVVIFGDSITAQDVNGSDGVSGYGSSTARGYWAQAQLQLQQRFVLLNNAGVGGNTTAQMLARIQADVLAYTPGYCIVEGGGNDVTNAVTAATTIANLTSIYTALRAVGITVVATTILPTTSANTADEKLVLYTINNWIRGYVSTQAGMILCDWYAYVADPSTGDPATNMTFDGITHPSQQGAYLLGSKLAAELAPLTYIADPLPFANVEVGSVTLPNPRMVGAAPGTNVTVAANSGAPTLTNSKVARTDGVQGEWAQTVATGGTDYFRYQQQATVNVAAATTATGVNAINSATVNCGSTTGFATAGATLPGAFMLGGVLVTFTGTTATSFTGCGSHPATTGGEAITSPLSVNDRVYAVAEVEIDPGATMVAKNGEVPVFLEIINQDGTGVIYCMFTASGEGTYAGGIPTGRLALRTPNFKITGAGSSRLFVRVGFYLNGTIRLGRTQIYKATATSIYG